jgi:hypothetical protein
MEGTSDRLPRRAPQPAGDPLPEFSGGPPTEGEDQHVAGADLAATDPIHDRLDDRGGLPGAGAGQQEQRTAAVIHHGALIRSQDRRLDQCRRRPHQPWAQLSLLARSAPSVLRPTSLLR